MSKKLIIFLMCFMLSTAPVVAFEEPYVNVVKCEIDATDTLNVIVEVENPLVNVSVGITMTNAKPNEKEIIYLEQKDVTIEDISNNKATLAFNSYPFPATAKTGVYNVTVGGNGLNKAEKSVYYRGTDQVKLALDAVVKADKEQIEQALNSICIDGAKCADVLNVKSELLSNLKNQKSLAQTIINNKDSILDVSNLNSSVTEDCILIKEKAIQFRKLYADCIAIGSFGDLDEGSSVGNWIKNNNTTTQDDPKYDYRYDFDGCENPTFADENVNEELKKLYNVKTILNDMASGDLADNGKREDYVYESIDTKELVTATLPTDKNNLEDYNLSLIRNEISEKTLLAIFDKMTYSYNREKVEKHKNHFNFDYTNYNLLNDGNKDNVFRNMKGKYTALSSCADEFKKHCIQLLEEQNSNKNSGNSGGSFGGGGGGNVIKGSVSPDSKTQIPQIKETPFTDLQNFLWAKDAIANLSQKGIVSGRTSTTFAPNENITRGEFTKLLICALNGVAKDAKCDFKDVDETHWFYPYVATAKLLEIVNGNPDGTFNPNSNISREDMAVMIERGLKKAGVTLKNGEPTQYSDSNEISIYALDSVNILSYNKIMNGFDDDTFKPKKLANRAESAVVVEKMWLEVHGTNKR